MQIKNHSVSIATNDLSSILKTHTQSKTLIFLLLKELASNEIELNFRLHIIQICKKS